MPQLEDKEQELFVLSLLDDQESFLLPLKAARCNLHRPADSGGHTLRQKHRHRQIDLVNPGTATFIAVERGIRVREVLANRLLLPAYFLRILRCMLSAARLVEHVGEDKAVQGPSSRCDRTIDVSGLRVFPLLDLRKAGNHLDKDIGGGPQLERKRLGRHRREKPDSSLLLGLFRLLGLLLISPQGLGIAQSHQVVPADLGSHGPDREEIVVTRYGVLVNTLFSTVRRERVLRDAERIDSAGEADRYLQLLPFRIQEVLRLGHHIDGLEGGAGYQRPRLLRQGDPPGSPCRFCPS